MSRLEKVDGKNWREFLSAPIAVLVLGKTTCPVCQAFTSELEAFLADDAAWRHVRFGKMLLDEGGLADFKRASPWLADVDVLPFTQIYRNGVRWKDFAGGGVDRLRRRLDTLPRSVDAPGEA
jgi:hypothetical protein